VRRIAVTHDASGQSHSAALQPVYGRGFLPSTGSFAVFAVAVAALIGAAVYSGKIRGRGRG
jgi:hypothetical protein